MSGIALFVPQDERDLPEPSKFWDKLILTHNTQATGFDKETYTFLFYFVITIIMGRNGTSNQ